MVAGADAASCSLSVVGVVKVAENMNLVLGDNFTPNKASMVRFPFSQGRGQQSKFITTSQGPLQIW